MNTPELKGLDIVSQTILQMGLRLTPETWLALNGINEDQIDAETELPDWWENPPPPKLGQKFDLAAVKALVPHKG